MKDSSLLIRITPGTIAMVLLLGLLGYFLYVIRGLLLIVIAAVVFSLALAPGKRLLMRCRIPEPLSVLLLYLVGFALLGFFAYSLLPVFVQQYHIFFEALPQLIEMLAGLVQGTVFENLLALDQLREFLTSSNQLSASVQSTLTFAGSGIFSLFGGLVNVVLFLLLTFLFSVNPGSLDTFLQVITPKRYLSYVEDLWDRTKVKMSQWFQGQIVLIFVISALVYFALLVLGIPNALFLAIFAGLMELLPIFGPVLGAIPALLMAITVGDPVTVLLVLAVFFIIQQLENTLIYPLVVSKVVGISSVLIVLAIVVGGSIAGFVGVVIAVPLAAVLQEFFSDLQTGKLQKMCSGKKC